MATIGQALTAPEADWKRYDNTDSKFIYYGTWGNIASGYGGNSQETWITNGSVKFLFKGTKFRVIASGYSSFSTGLKVKIDDVEVGSFTQYASSTARQIFQYEKTGLVDGKHYVEIYNPVASTGFSWDALDINDTGELLDYWVPTNRFLLSSGNNKLFSINQNQGAYLKDANSSIRIIPSSTQLLNNHGSAIMFRIKTTSTKSGVLINTNTGSSAGGYMISLQSDGTLSVMTIGSKNSSVVSNKRINDGSWHDVVVHLQTTRNSSNNSFSIYIDDLNTPNVTITGANMATAAATNAYVLISGTAEEIYLKDIVFKSGYDAEAGESYKNKLYSEMKSVYGLYTFEKSLNDNIVKNTGNSQVSNGDNGLAYNVQIIEEYPNFLGNDKEDTFITYGNNVNDNIVMTKNYSKLLHVSDDSTVLSTGKIYEHIVDMSKRQINKITLG